MITKLEERLEAELSEAIEEYGRVARLKIARKATQKQLLAANKRVNELRQQLNKLINWER